MSVNIIKKYLSASCSGIDSLIRLWNRRGRDRMVVIFTTTCAISACHHLSSNPAHGEVYSIQHYVIKFVSDSFLRFPPTMALTVTI